MKDLSARPPNATLNLQTGFEQLSRLPLAHPEQAKRGLDDFFDHLLNMPPEAEIYLALLEHSHESLYFVAEDLARRFTDRPLPLKADEEQGFREVIATWLKIARAYAHCAIRDKAVDDAAHATRIALMMQRCLHFTGRAIVEHQRARRQLPPRLWNTLLAYYATAEKWGVALQDVPDPHAAPGHTTHCTTTFVSVLLSELANPYSLSIRDQNLIRRWAHSGAPLVCVLRATNSDLPEFIIDLTQDQAVLPSNHCTTPRHKIRILDTSRLTAHLKGYRQQIKENVPPEKIGLGHDCDARQCARLLKLVARPWSQVRMQRKFRRLNVPGIAHLCLHSGSIYSAISGRPFVQPGSKQTSAHRNAPVVTEEQWTILNQSANGFRLMRPILGERIAWGQLLAIRTGHEAPFLLAHTTWLMQEHGGNLTAGIALLPGKAHAVAVRLPASDDTPAGAYHEAFLLPAVPAVDEESSLLIPHGWFRSGRIVEICSNISNRVKLKRLVHEGPDFDRVSFIPG